MKRHLLRSRPRAAHPRAPRLRAVAAALAAAAALVLPVTVAQSAHAATTTCQPQDTIAAGDYTIQANEWNSTAQQCITYNGGTAWSIDTANFNLPTNGAPATYPSIFKGCHWGDCTPNSGLPIQVSKLGSATSSWSTTQVGSGAYDVAYDLWINSTPTTAGQPDGTEIMIWLNSRGGVQPFGGKTGTSTAAGHSWDVWTGNQTSWKIISYVLQGGATSVSGLDVKALIDDAVSRGSVNPAHYLIDAEAGFEVWQGGQGLATTSFSFTAGAGSGGDPGGDTQAPSAPAGLTVTGTTASSASLSWSPSSDNVGVTGYDVYRGGQLAGTATGTSFTDTGLAASTAYTYTVKARDAAGNASAASSPVTATTTAGGGNPPGDGGCTASYRVSSDWGSGFTADVTVTSGTTAIHGWRVGWTYAGSQHITNAWNATVTQSGSAVTAVDAGYNGSLAASASTSFGFQGTGSGAVPTLTCTAS
ncbi:cellulose binding domain-containing protein [Actinacidiphila sp. DG2A-62]|uniref:GH12 family glycosyl hydrolase domain-containing protein n=1 Tax=Actinacidiphila sp. DG2A-62 TaxID=3108821 RepID=UPI002DBDAD2E|nr:cellulose binding domain-containing protein [Actinacidiphila sp. DG2A-62]MEC3992347.1 cellulose binding domain-containing protein [Actinacidiphila sp. DG2A-62]